MKAAVFIIKITGLYRTPRSILAGIRAALVQNIGAVLRHRKGFSFSGKDAFIRNLVRNSPQQRRCGAASVRFRIPKGGIFRCFHHGALQIFRRFPAVLQRGGSLSPCKPPLPFQNAVIIHTRKGKRLPVPVAIIIGTVKQQDFSPRRFLNLRK